MNTRPPVRPRNTGFTLIELVFALVLLIVLTGLAFPSVRAWVDRTRLESAVNELTGDLAFARMLAVRENTPAALQTSVDGFIYSIVVDGVPRKSVDLRQEFPGVLLTGGLTLTFDSRGLLQAGGATIQATKDGKVAQLTVSSVGRALRDF